MSDIIKSIRECYEESEETLIDQFKMPIDFMFFKSRCYGNMQIVILRQHLP